MLRTASLVAVLALLAGSAWAGPREKGTAESGGTCAMCPAQKTKVGASCPMASAKEMQANLNADKPKCPMGGGYDLKTTPDKEHPAAVKIYGKTYFVCTHCAKALKAAKAGKPSKGQATKKS